MQNWKIARFLIIAALSAFVFVGCDDDDITGGVADTVTDAASDVADTASDAVDSAADTASDAADSAEDAARSAADDVQDAVDTSSDDSSSDNSSSAAASTSGGGGAGFVWKPVSEGDGNLVVLLNSGDGSTSLSISGAFGSESGRYVGRTNGNRATFRFSRPGCAYGSNIRISNGVTIASGCNRVDG